jgi:methanogenic corrinoid protein MtbC1
VELSSADVRPDISDVESLTRLLLSHDVDVAAAFLNSLKTAGVPSDRILLHLLAPAARRLGDLWDDDVADFTQVTVGLFRLHQLLRRIAPEAPPATEAREFGRRALLVPFPGEQHTFGLWLVAEFMRRNGWYVRNEPVASASSVVEMVRAEWFACIGITVANESQVEKLGTLIQSVRRASRNHAIGVLVGGPLLLARPEIAALVGADATATDARHAVAQAESVCKWLEVGPGEGHPLAGTPVR